LSRKPPDVLGYSGPVYRELRLKKGLWPHTLKWVFVAFNMVMVAIAVMCLIASIIYYLNLENKVFTPRYYNRPLVVWWFMMGVTSVTLLLSLAGFIGALAESRAILFCYAVLMTFITLLVQAILVMCIVYRLVLVNELNKTAREWLQDDYQEVGDPFDPGIQKVVETLMQKERCCYFSESRYTHTKHVVRFWHDETNWGRRRLAQLQSDPQKPTYLVPSRLCCDDPENCPKVTYRGWKAAEVNGTNAFVFDKSCSGAFGEHAATTYTILGGTATAMLLLMVLLILTAVHLYRNTEITEYYMSLTSGSPGKGSGTER
jgi:hypothetical protein